MKILFLLFLLFYILPSTSLSFESIQNQTINEFFFNQKNNYKFKQLFYSLNNSVDIYIVKGNYKEEYGLSFYIQYSQGLRIHIHSNSLTNELEIINIMFPFYIKNKHLFYNYNIYPNLIEYYKDNYKMNILFINEFYLLLQSNPYWSSLLSYSSLFNYPYIQFGIHLYPNISTIQLDCSSILPISSILYKLPIYTNTILYLHLPLSISIQNLNYSSILIHSYSSISYQSLSFSSSSSSPLSSILHSKNLYYYILYFKSPIHIHYSLKQYSRFSSLLSYTFTNINQNNQNYSIIIHQYIPKSLSLYSINNNDTLSFFLISNQSYTIQFYFLHKLLFFEEYTLFNEQGISIPSPSILINSSLSLYSFNNKNTLHFNPDSTMKFDSITIATLTIYLFIIYFFKIIIK
ncbi:hypothetical protein WA158_006696 [Blastocystis sp. Blastoise]